MHPCPKMGILGDPQPVWDSFIVLSSSWEGVGRIYSAIIPPQSVIFAFPEAWLNPFLPTPRSARSSPNSLIISSLQLRGGDSHLCLPLDRLMYSCSSSLQQVGESRNRLALCVRVYRIWVATVWGHGFPGTSSLALSTLTKETDRQVNSDNRVFLFWWPSDVQTRSPCLLAWSAVCRRGAALLKGGRWMHNLS